MWKIYQCQCISNSNCKLNTIFFLFDSEFLITLHYLDTEGIVQAPKQCKASNEHITSVQTMAIHTERYLTVHQNHALSTKNGIIKTLIDRAKIICSTQQVLWNGYPEKTPKSLISTFIDFQLICSSCTLDIRKRLKDGILVT